MATGVLVGLGGIGSRSSERGREISERVATSGPPPIRQGFCGIHGKVKGKVFCVGHKK